jgi:AcrR family transcriptional regulator
VAWPYTITIFWRDIKFLRVPQFDMAKLISFTERRAALSTKSRRRAEDILRAATWVFVELGYEKTTTLEIAQRLGISEATVFTYFDGKRDLCTQVISNWYDDISTALENDLPRRAGTREQLGFIVHKHLHSVVGDGQGLCALVLTEGRSPHTGFSELLNGLQRRYTAPLMAVLAAGQQSGEIRDDMPLRLLRNMVYGSMEHILWGCINTGRSPDLEADSRQVTDLLWCAFAPPNRQVDALMRLKLDVEAAVRRFDGHDAMPPAGK